MFESQNLLSAAAIAKTNYLQSLIDKLNNTTVGDIEEKISLNSKKIEEQKQEYLFKIEYLEKKIKLLKIHTRELEDINYNLSKDNKIIKKQIMQILKFLNFDICND